MDKYTVLFDPEDGRWYVKEVVTIDMGRFTTEQAAEEHKRWLDETYGYGAKQS